jgi:ribosomal-protein-alanine N-acetyltransferase
VSSADLEVHGPNLRLRIPREADARRLFELASDPEVTRFFSWGPYEREEDAAAWLASLPARRDSGEALELAIADREDWVIGIIAVLEVSMRDRRSVVGIWLGQAYWGTGASAEAEALLAHLVFGPLRMERLAAWVDVRNVRSQRSFEKLGYVREGVLRGWHRHGDERRDLVAFAVLREDFESSPMAAVPAVVHGEPPAAFVCPPRPG